MCSDCKVELFWSVEVTYVGHHPAGHEGDPCLRSSDCMEGFCCARHFWTKICKPVLHQGEVCTKQRKKGSHGLEIFQRCDCAKGLSCKVWKDATYSSKARLHVCQKIWSLRRTCSTSRLNLCIYVHRSTQDLDLRRMANARRVIRIWITEGEKEKEN